MSERAVWVLVLLALVALVLYGMRRGWTKRARRQTSRLPGLPPVPANLSGQQQLVPEATGLYVGTTFAHDWQDRLTFGGLGNRAGASAQLRHSGVLLERAGSDPLWIPAESLRGARVDHKLANKVVPGKGMLVMTWQLGEHRLDTGFRGEDKTRQNEWAEAVRELVPAGEADEER